MMRVNSTGSGATHHGLEKLDAVTSPTATDLSSAVPLDNITTSQNQLPLPKKYCAIRAHLAGTLTSSRWLPRVRAAHLDSISKRKGSSFVVPATLESINIKKGARHACHAE